MARLEFLGNFETGGIELVAGLGACITFDRDELCACGNERELTRFLESRCKVVEKLLDPLLPPTERKRK